jgi:hypothetical protein
MTYSKLVANLKAEFRNVVRIQKWFRLLLFEGTTFASQMQVAKVAFHNQANQA